MRIRPSYLVLALLALALRALIPIGFMPASDGTLSLMICPGGFPPELLPPQQTISQDMGQGMGQGMAQGMRMPMPHPHHGHGLMEDGFCAFTTGFSAAPVPLILAPFCLLLAVIAIVLTSMSAPPGLRRVQIPQARAPPASS